MNGSPGSDGSLDGALDPSLDPGRFREIESCALCGSKERKEKFAEPPFHIVECSRCGLVYVTPRLKEDALHEVYNEDYWSSKSPKTRGYADYRSEADLYLKTFRKRMALLKRYHPSPGRALDIGCAAGYFLRVLREEGWEGRGIELSPDIGKEAIQALGEDKVHIGDIQDAPFQEGSFDLVSLWDVIEHVPDPHWFLDQALRFLKPDGILILETQNVKSRFAGWLGPKWQHYKHLEHLYHFNPETIERLLDDAGMELLHLTSKWGGKHVSLGFIRERATRVHKAFGVLLLPLAPFSRVNLYINPHDEMILVARRKNTTPND